MKDLSRSGHVKQKISFCFVKEVKMTFNNENKTLTRIFVNESENEKYYSQDSLKCLLHLSVPCTVVWS